MNIHLFESVDLLKPLLKIWNDKDLNISWNFKKYGINENELIISEKDKKNMSFKEYKKINNIE